ncbi:MAG: hypothetical protein WC674_07210 [Candidatus Krumholzibacteriia bacterium]
MTIRSLITLMALASAGYSQGIPWSSFEWSGGSIGDKAFDRAALMVPVRLEHKPDVFWMQLDTGCNVTMVYQIPFDQLKYPAQRIKSRDDFIPLSGTIGNCPFSSFPVFVREDFGDSIGAMKERILIGTVGQDMLVGKVLVLDYPNRRFCLVDSLDGELEALVSRASFVDLQRRNDKLFVPVRIGDIYSENFFLDTGASMLPITTTKEIWRRLTGRQGTEKSNIRIKVPSWGKEVAIVGAPVKGTLTIGTLQVWNPIAYFESTGIVETDGLLGNALFYDEYTIIIDLMQNRFGILRNQ